MGNNNYCDNKHKILIYVFYNGKLGIVSVGRSNIYALLSPVTEMGLCLVFKEFS